MAALRKGKVAEDAESAVAAEVGMGRQKIWLRRPLSAHSHAIIELIRFRFKAVHSKRHSFLTFLRPRNRNERNPSACFIQPNTGSTMDLRFLYLASPRLPLRRRAIRAVAGYSAEILGVSSCSRPQALLTSPLITGDPLSAARRQLFSNFSDK